MNPSNVKVPENLKTIVSLLNIDKDGGMCGFLRNLYPITLTTVIALPGC